jgi:hypothetical protein
MINSSAQSWADVRSPLFESILDQFTNLLFPDGMIYRYRRESGKVRIYASINSRSPVTFSPPRTPELCPTDRFPHRIPQLKTKSREFHAVCTRVPPVRFPTYNSRFDSILQYLSQFFVQFHNNSAIRMTPWPINAERSESSHLSLNSKPCHLVDSHFSK